VIPRLRDWHTRYENTGLTIVGVHTPEFFWEKPQDKVAAATRELGIRYPVVQDNDSMIWNRWGVRAWPTTAGRFATVTSVRAPMPRPRG